MREETLWLVLAWSRRQGPAGELEGSGNVSQLGLSPQPCPQPPAAPPGAHLSPPVPISVLPTPSSMTTADGDYRSAHKACGQLGNWHVARPHHGENQEQAVVLALTMGSGAVLPRLQAQSCRAEAMWPICAWPSSFVTQRLGCRVVVVHTFDPSTGEPEAGGSL